MQEFIAAAPRHRRAAGRGAQGLRGVRPPLPPRVGRPGQPLAALDAAERDDLRRPRHPRRLEHQLDAGASEMDADRRGGTTASSAAWRRTGSTSTSATSARPSAPRTSSGSGSRRTTATDELDLTDELDALAERADQDPDCYRWSFARDFGGQARLVVVDSRAARVLRARPPLDARRRARWPGSTSSCAATSTTCWSARRCRSCSPRACTTSRRSARRSPGRVGQARRRRGGAAAAGGRPRALGGVPAGLPRGRRDGRWRSRPAAAGRRPAPSRSCPATSTTATSPTAWPTRRHRRARDEHDPAGGLLPDPQPAADGHGAGDRRSAPGARLARVDAAARAAGRRSPRSPLRWELDRGPWYDNNLAVLEVRDEGRLHLRWVGRRHRGPAHRPAEAPYGVGGRRPAQALSRVGPSSPSAASGWQEQVSEQAR